MANSANYDATKEDSRPWRTDHDSRASDADEASVANAGTLQDETRDSSPITSIVVTPATKTIDLSDEETLQLEVQPMVDSDEYDGGVAVTYTSSDPTKATVSDSGLVTPVAAGTSTITVKWVVDEQVTDTCAITVQA